MEEMIIYRAMAETIFSVVATVTIRLLVALVTTPSTVVAETMKYKANWETILSM
jgi:hypothetical protein